jgi:hypothetical protein
MVDFLFTKERYFIMSGALEAIDRHSPEKIVEILHSITKLDIIGGELEVWFDNGEHSEVCTSFIPGSFTRKLLELIESHLVGE